MIIRSLLDTDLYKFTMMQVAWHRFRDASVEYQFHCRTPNINLSHYIRRIKSELDDYCQLQLTQDELDYLSSLPFFKKDFIEFLRGFQLPLDAVQIKSDPEFSITIRGLWHLTILFEVPILSIISEIYSTAHQDDLTFARQLLMQKIQLIKSSGSNVHFSDFGTRRRYSFAWQQEVLQTLIREVPENLVGTSNLFFAKELGVMPIGTMAHEYLQACQVLSGSVVGSQRYAFQNWLDEYGQELGIALSDIFGLEVFLQEFDVNFSTQFSGVRHDSGDPFQWGEKMIAHYRDLGIDPKTKSLVFSDSITMPLAIGLYERYHKSTNIRFGIGTNLTNDVGAQPIQIVIKMMKCNNTHTVKISDSPGKASCLDMDYLLNVKQQLGIE